AVYQDHECEVPMTFCKTVSEPRSVMLKTYTREPVWTQKTIKVCTGNWHEERHYCPGPVQTYSCRLPGTWDFDPCSCKCCYCPGPVVQKSSQSPGHWVCNRTWVPREELRTVSCCHYVYREHIQTVNYTVSKLVPYTVVKNLSYRTCKLIPEEHVQM